MSSDPDYTLEELYERGINDLTDEHVTPGTTYEMAPGLVGTLTWPTLQVREEFYEAREELQDLFREDASPEDYRALSEAVAEGKTIPEGSNPVREEVSVMDWEQTNARVNCRQALLILEFEEESVEMHDFDPNMAAVVSAHFTALRPGQNGQASS